MLRFLIRRISFSLLSLIIISFLMFFLVSNSSEFLSGFKLERYVPPEEADARDATERIFIENIEKNWFVRYTNWLSHALRGQLGYSNLYRLPVMRVFKRVISNTLVLTLTAFIVSWSIGIPLGIYSAIHNRKIRSTFSSIIAFIGISTPEFFLALLGIYFAYLTRIFPIGGIISSEALATQNWFIILMSQIHHLILPTILLASMNLSRTYKIVKGEVLDQLGSDYVEFAEAKGLPKKYIVRHHIFRNCMNPLATNMGMQFGTLLTGSLFIEFIFSIDGIGAVTIISLNINDQPMAMASLSASALLLILGNLLSDIFLAYIDPRIRLQVFK